MRKVYPFIVEALIKAGVKTPEDLAAVKRKLAKKYQISCPKNISLLKTYHEITKNKSHKKSPILENLLRARPVRSLSGIVNISVLTKPYPCPGKCLYCPSEKGIPKSYVSGEPAVERAKKLKYDPYRQVKKRIEMLELEGHPTDKIELRIVGGTWSYYPKRYRDWFVKRSFEACNPAGNPTNSSLSRAQKLNQKAKHRIVGLSVETRPDFISQEEIKDLRKLGVTLVELGVQSIDDEVLKLNRRGHKAKEIINATRLLKEAGFKVLYQMMPNLPGSNPSRDLKMFKKLFSNPDFRPDLLKIYPCALVKEAPLYQWWKKKKYQPYTEKELINLICQIKTIIPRYVRIQRIMRDIPSPRIVAGPAKISNLRQILAKKVKCQCIRCREVKENYNPKEKLYFFRQDYPASGGREIFLTLENKNRTKLYSLLRLRINAAPAAEAIVRELRTYGQLHPLAKPRRNSANFSLTSPQHKGLGKKLMKRAEKIAGQEFGAKKIAVISGVGAQPYYRRLGYKLEGTYMIKLTTKR